MSQLLPHRGPALLVERVLSHGPDETRCEASIDTRLHYLEGGHVSSVVCLEYLAQAAGAHVGLGSGAGARPTGYLAAVKELRLEQPSVHEGQHLIITVRPEARAGTLAQFSGTVEVDGALWASARFTVYDPSLAESADASQEPT